MRRLIFAVLSVFFVLYLNAQDVNNFRFLKGRVIDAVGNQPVAYTNIGIEGTLYGTASNADGDFGLKIPGDLTGKNIYFSAVGFKNQVFPLTDLIGKEGIIIKLSPQTYDIGEIDISARSQVILRILRSASANIPSNFLPGPFRLTCSYENERIINDTLTLTRKAEVIVNDLSGYSNPDKISAYHQRGYSFDKVSRNFRSYSFPDGSTNLDELLDLDWARARSSVLNPDLYSSFDLNKADDQVFNGKKLYVIIFKQSVPTLEGSGEFYGSRFEGKIYIDADSYTVNKIEGWTEAPRQNRQGRGLAIGKGNSSFLKDVSCDFTVSYTSGIPELITLNKHYRFQGKNVAERTRLAITGKKQLTEQVVIRRDYFEGD